MKKIQLFCLLALVLLSVTACVKNSSVPQNEGMDPRYAYVVGKLSTGVIEAVWSNGSEEISMAGSYVVCKVAPGTYSLSEFYMGGNRYSYTTRKPAFTVQAGKISYVGDITLNHSSVSVASNPDSAKEHVRTGYPALAGELNEQFTTVDLHWVESSAKPVSGWKKFNR